MVNYTYTVVPYSISTSNHNLLAAIAYKCLVVPYSISTSNHNLLIIVSQLSTLFLILFLHQTTTNGELPSFTDGCSLFYFYIKPQRLDHSIFCITRCSLFYFYIKPQPWNEGVFGKDGCSLFYFYIKPQLVPEVDYYQGSCSLFYFYIKPQRNVALVLAELVVPYSISTSNHNFKQLQLQRPIVVPYSISTSNHNCLQLFLTQVIVVPYSISTSNHNAAASTIPTFELFLILFLHQTTTSATLCGYFHEVTSF